MSVSDRELLERLDTIARYIKAGVYSLEIKQDIHDSLESYVTGVSTVDPKALNYLLLGWSVAEHLNEVMVQQRPS